MLADPAHPKPITPHQLAALRWAVENCATLRGMLTGGPAEVLDEFDHNIQVARQALKELEQ